VADRELPHRRQEARAQTLRGHRQRSYTMTFKTMSSHIKGLLPQASHQKIRDLTFKKIRDLTFECQSVTHHDSNFEMRTLHKWESKPEATPRCIHNISKHRMIRPSNDYEWFTSCNRSWRRLRTHKSTWRNINK
jgi:hypothetical protein